MSKPKEYSWMTKDKLMTYTFIALLILAIITSIMWSGIGQESLINTPSGWNLGLTVAICCFLAVGIAVALDAFLYKIAEDSQLNLMSAAVFGLIVALSYTLGIPAMNSGQMLPVEAPGAFIYVGLISLVGLILFKKVLGGSGRKPVNPAAAAKFLVLLPLANTVLIAADHLKTGMLGVPSLSGPIGYEIIGENGFGSFASYIQTCFANPTVALPTSTTTNDIVNILLLQKYHGWVGGASSIAVIIVGLGLFIVARRYIKWRITLSYLVTAALVAYIMSFIAGGDPLLRVMYHLFIGSSIFLAFFMATDPASTPITYSGQVIFGVGLAVIGILIQSYMNFFGGTILALVIMNLVAPKLDAFGGLKPTAEKKTPKLPKAKQFIPEEVKVYPCIRCGACMRVCCHKLSPIMIKEAYESQNVDKLMKLQSNLCDGCGHCNFVCPARIDLRASILKSKAFLRGE